RLADFAGSTRTIRPPWLLAATAMLPPMRKASPPNIFFSVTSDSPTSRSRTPSASLSSEAMEAIVEPGDGRAPTPGSQATRLDRPIPCPSRHPQKGVRLRLGLAHG